jgi:hypothetical protein
MPCFFKFASAFLGSQMTIINYIVVHYLVVTNKITLIAELFPISEENARKSDLSKFANLAELGERRNFPQPLSH